MNKDIQPGLRYSNDKPLSSYVPQEKSATRGFSLVDAIRGTLDPVYHSNSLDMARNYEYKNGITAKAGSFIVPVSRADRDQNTDDDENLVGEDHLSASFIDLLSPDLILKQAGAQTLTALRGDIDIPRQSDSTTCYWVGEGDAPTNSNASFNSVKASPKTVGGYIDMTRRILLQSDPSIEQLIRLDLSRTLRQSIEMEAIAGDGGSGVSPLGITKTVGIETLSGGKTWGSLMDIITAVEVNNAKFSAFFVNPTTFGEFLTIPKLAGEAMFCAEIVNGEKRLGGSRVFTTSALAVGEVLGGDFSQCILAEWGSPISIEVDPYSLSTSGGVRVTGFADVDVVVRHPEAFCLGTLA